MAQHRTIHEAHVGPLPPPGAKVGIFRRQNELSDALRLALADVDRIRFVSGPVAGTRLPELGPTPGWPETGCGTRAGVAVRGTRAIDKNICQWHVSHVLDLEVLDDPQAAALTLDPVKGRILAALATPGSAASLADQVGLTRQKVNYHLRLLEDHGLVKPVEERHWGGLRERLMVASAASYVVSPAALGPVASDPAHTRDRLAASYLIALAARIVREVGTLWRRARKSGKRLPTLSIDTVVSFNSPSDRAAFTGELTDAITQLCARYHGEAAPGARAYRLVIASYPAPKDQKS